MGQTFRGGIPYQVDVNRLKDAFPITSLAEGRVIKHDDLERVVKVRPGAQRYYGVINSWIGQMKHANGIFMVWEPSVGIKVLNPADILTFAETRTRQKMRQTRKAIQHFAWVDRSRLNDMDQQRLDHKMRISAAIRDSLLAANKELAVILAPVKSIREA